MRIKATHSIPPCPGAIAPQAHGQPHLVRKGAAPTVQPRMGAQPATQPHPDPFLSSAPNLRNEVDLFPCLAEQ